MSEELFDRIRLGDKFSFELLYRKYFEKMCSFANKFLQDNELATEVVNDVFMNVWNNRNKLDPNNMFQSYLFVSTKNRSLNELQRQKKESKFKEVITATYLEGQEMEVRDSLVIKEMEERIKKIIDELPPKCREIFLMSRYEDKKNREIAEELNISLKTVETQMTRALKVFRRELQEYMTVVLLTFF